MSSEKQFDVESVEDLTYINRNDLYKTRRNFFLSGVALATVAFASLDFLRFGAQQFELRPYGSNHRSHHAPVASYNEEPVFGNSHGFPKFEKVEDANVESIRKLEHAKFQPLLEKTFPGKAWKDLSHEEKHLFKVISGQANDEIFSKHFPGKKWESLSNDEKHQYKELVHEAEVREQKVEAKKAKKYGKYKPMLEAAFPGKTWKTLSGEEKHFFKVITGQANDELFAKTFPGKKWSDLTKEEIMSYKKLVQEAKAQEHAEVKGEDSVEDKALEAKKAQMYGKFKPLLEKTFPGKTWKDLSHDEKHFFKVITGQAKDELFSKKFPGKKWSDLTKEEIHEYKSLVAKIDAKKAEKYSKFQPLLEKTFPGKAWNQLSHDEKHLFKVITGQANDEVFAQRFPGKKWSDLTKAEIHEYKALVEEAKVQEEKLQAKKAEKYGKFKPLLEKTFPGKTWNQLSGEEKHLFKVITGQANDELFAKTFPGKKWSDLTKEEIVSYKKLVNEAKAEKSVSVEEEELQAKKAKIYAKYRPMRDAIFPGKEWSELTHEEKHFFKVVSGQIEENLLEKTFPGKKWTDLNDEEKQTLRSLNREMMESKAANVAKAHLI